MTSRLDSFLSSVNQMTHYHLQESVDKAFLFSLLNLFPIEEASIINVYHGASSKLIESKKIMRPGQDSNKPSMLSPNRLVLEDHYLRTCMEKQTLCTRLVDGMVINHIPITINDTVMFMLRITSKALESDEHRLIEQLCLAYRNHSSVIYENEHDTLTKLLNRKTFDNKLAYVLEHYAASLRHSDETTHAENNRRSHVSTEVNPFWLGLFDIDHFKHVNDTYGHLYGDEVLLLISQLMRESFRVNDMLFRYGGEEFIVILDQTNEAQAFEIFERFRQRIADYEFPQVGRITISIGISKAMPEQLPRTIVDQADQALYFAKHNGRNQTHYFCNLVATGQIDQIITDDNIELF